MTLLTFYWLSFAGGGVFVLLALLGGHSLDSGAPDLDGHLFDLPSLHLPAADGQTDSDADHDLELVDAPADGRRRRSLGLFILSLFTSLKFYTFALCFFGLTGLVLSNLSMPLPAGAIAALAVSMGLVCGTLVSGSLQFLRRRRVDSLVRCQDLVGLSGTVEIPFDADSRGKVRLLVKGSTVDFIAYTDDQRALRPGDPVLIVGTENNRLWVVAADPDSQQIG
jgi:hypothetical protein